MSIIFGLILLGLVFIPPYFLYRNEKVYNFRCKIVDLIFLGQNTLQKRKIYLQGPSYDKMLYSIKPLKLESFYTDDEIKILKAE